MAVILHFKLKTDFMADAANRYPENVPGKYYVDNQCIDCDLCRETAPDNFKRNDDGGYSFVYKQPASPDEETRCKEAKEGCPVEAMATTGLIRVHTAVEMPESTGSETRTTPGWPACGGTISSLRGASR